MIEAADSYLATAESDAARLAPFLADGGVLEIPVQAVAVDRLRVELGEPQFLHLQSIGISSSEGESPSDIAASATVTASSWYKAYKEKFTANRLFDLEHSHGTQIHTTADGIPWIEIDFAVPLDIETIRLRNVSNGTWARAAAIKVTARTTEGWSTLFDATGVTSQVLASVLSLVEPVSVETRTGIRAVIADTFAARYLDARTKFEALGLDPERARTIKAVLNRELLSPRKIEWTIHGPTRSFRYWTRHQKTLYTHLAATVAEELVELTPNVCFGFGAALCVVRDHAFIPHDDDLDIIIGFEPNEARTLPQALHRIEDFLRPRGYAVTGNFSAHRQVSWGSKAVDVFAGLFEGDVISWYPGARGALTRQIMFPTSVGSLYGVPVPLPNDPAAYLEAVYGRGWVTPNPDFKHSWDRSAYADLRQPG